MAVLLEYHGFCYKALVKSGTRHDGIDLLPPPVSTAYVHYVITLFLRILLNWSNDRRYMCVKQYTK